MSAPVYVERDGAIATVVLNRPERMNALDKAMWMQLGGLLRELAQCRHPTLALIEGACVGGGLLVASQCDLPICNA